MSAITCGASHSRTIADDIAALTAERDRLANELRNTQNDLVISQSRDKRSRTGWQFAKEANEAAQRYITILEAERDRLRENNYFSEIGKIPDKDN